MSDEVNAAPPEPVVQYDPKASAFLTGLSVPTMPRQICIGKVSDFDPVTISAKGWSVLPVQIEGLHGSQNSRLNLLTLPVWFSNGFDPETWIASFDTDAQRAPSFVYSHNLTREHTPGYLRCMLGRLEMDDSGALVEDDEGRPSEIGWKAFDKLRFERFRTEVPTPESVALLIQQAVEQVGAEFIVVLKQQVRDGDLEDRYEVDRLELLTGVRLDYWSKYCAKSPEKAIIGFEPLG